MNQIEHNRNIKEYKNNLFSNRLYYHNRKIQKIVQTQNKKKNNALSRSSIKRYSSVNLSKKNIINPKNTFKVVLTKRISIS